MVAPNQNQTIDPTQPPAPGSLEPLSQEESRFLSQFFRDFKEDLFAWSDATNIALDALAKWLNHPKIAAYVAALRHHQAQAAKRKCIDLLTAIVDSDEPLPEKRRAATTLLRAITPTGRASSRRTPRENGEQNPAPTHRCGASHQDRPGIADHTDARATSAGGYANRNTTSHSADGASCANHNARDATATT